MIKNTSVKDAALYDRMVMPGTNPDGYVNIDSLIADQDYYIEAGLQKEKINMADLVDQSFAQAAVKQLGLYK